MNDEDVPHCGSIRKYTQNAGSGEWRHQGGSRLRARALYSAIQLMKNIEQRKQSILKVCQAIVRRQTEFLSYGLDT